MSLNPPIRDRAPTRLASVKDHSQPGLSRDMSSAKLNLELILDQDRRGSVDPTKKNAGKPGDAIIAPPPQGKPRLMLMGQRR